MQASVSPLPTPTPPNPPLSVEEAPVPIEEVPRPVEGESCITWGSLDPPSKEESSKKKGKKERRDKKAPALNWDEEPRKVSDEDVWLAPEPLTSRSELEALAPAWKEYPVPVAEDKLTRS